MRNGPTVGSTPQLKLWHALPAMAITQISPDIQINPGRNETYVTIHQQERYSSRMETSGGQ